MTAVLFEGQHPDPCATLNCITGSSALHSSPPENENYVSLVCQQVALNAGSWLHQGEAS